MNSNSALSAAARRTKLAMNSNLPLSAAPTNRRGRQQHVRSADQRDLTGLRSDAVTAARISLRVADLRVLAAQTACEYGREQLRLLILQLRPGRDDGSRCE
jgi:hypothetical protein